MIRNRYSYGKISLSDIAEELKIIQESNTDYISPSGRVFKLCFNGKYIEKKVYINKHNGYCYVTLTCKDGKNRNRRVHRLIAQSFIENPMPGGI